MSWLKKKLKKSKNQMNKLKNKIKNKAKHTSVDVLDNIPIVGQVKAVVHAAQGDHDKAQRAALASLIPGSGIIGAVADEINDKVRYESPKLLNTNKNIRQCDWMTNYKHYKIQDLFIPGSHDCASYSINNNMFGGSWARTQKLDITQQLNIGIRFLDFRVMSADSKVYVAHRFKGCLFADCLQQIKYFVDNNNSEIVIIKMVKDSDNECNILDAYNDVLNIIGDSLINDEIDEYKHPDDVKNKSIYQLTQNGTKGRVLLVSDEDIDKCNLLWQYKSSWNKYNCTYPQDWYAKYKRFLQNVDTEYNTDFVVMAGECTPDTKVIAQSIASLNGVMRGIGSAAVKEQFKNCQDLAAATNYQLDIFLREEKFTYKTPLIITHDFIDSTIIKKIIDLNEKLQAIQKSNQRKRGLDEAFDDNEQAQNKRQRLR